MTIRAVNKAVELNILQVLNDLLCFPASSLMHKNYPLPHTKCCICCICPVIQEKLYGKSIIVADRDMVETESDAILANADKEDVAFLVVGDPFGCVAI
jgi:hypothetical protein